MLIYLKLINNMKYRYYSGYHLSISDYNNNILYPIPSITNLGN